MPNPNVLIDQISGLVPSAATLAGTPRTALPPTVNVMFVGGRSGKLDLNDRRSLAWAQVLDSLQRRNRPAYIEIDPHTELITRLLLPRPVRIETVHELPGGDLSVAVMMSPALHRLQQDQADFAALRAALEAARDTGSAVLLTATDEQEIVDVRPLPSGVREPPVPVRDSPPAPDDPPVTPAEAQTNFDGLKALACDSCAPTAPCITFAYPQNGCYARAHEMCRLMLADGREPEKIWIYASGWPAATLEVATANTPTCSVGWRYHVAPTLNVDTGSGIERWVLDPSLFPAGPVSESTWHGVQGDPAATLEYSGPSVYYKGPGSPVGITDDSYTDTADTLEDFREELILRCATYGPAPYSCPVVRRCTIITDRSSFGEDEVASMLAIPAPARFEAAFYVTVDGFSAQALGITSLTSVTWAPYIAETPEVGEMTITATSVAADYPDYLERVQRLTWTYRVDFSSTGAFSFVEDVRTVTLTVSASSESSSALILLLKQPNPYEIDGPTHWLSTDVRVFQLRAGESRFGAVMGASASDAPAYIQAALTNLNAGTAGGDTYDGISTNQTTSRLELSEQVDGQRVFNFAIARVRYRSTTLDAAGVRVFFRLFPVATTALHFDTTTTYRRGGVGGTVPLLGLIGGQLATIPFFAEERVNPATVAMTAQPDPTNVRDIPADGGAERHAYFGCWLDINQTRSLFPFAPFPADGPFPTGRHSIQEHIRGQHQCLVAEIRFDPAPISAGATPAMSDKLAQRNLAIVASDNPGTVTSHRVAHTFDVQATRATLGEGDPPDELMIDWGSIPRDCTAILYMPGIDTANVLAMADDLYSSHRLSEVDSDTLQCRTGGITFVPIPPGRGSRIAGLMSVDLPETVTREQVFTLVVHQVTGRPARTTVPAVTHALAHPVPGHLGRYVLGSFQLTIPVRSRNELLAAELRLLSVLRWIQRSIPGGDRWFNVFGRYVDLVAGRVDGFGGDSTVVAASPSGAWQGASASRCSRWAIAAGGLVGLVVVLLGLTGSGVPLVMPLVVFALALAVGFLWLRECSPSLCRCLWTLVTGIGTGAGVLGILASLGLTSAPLIPVLGISTAVLAVLALIATNQRCA